MPAGDTAARPANDPPLGAAAGPVEAVDGRVLRGERTRASILEALIGLLHDGELRPTARQIAERAGVSVRSIFQHFADLEGLYSDLVQIQAARVQPLVEALRTEGDLEERIAAMARQRAELFEAITPMRHAVGTRAQLSPVLAQRIRNLSDNLFEQVRSQFAPELARDGRTVQDIDALALTLDLLCSFESWDRLRSHHGLSVEHAEEMLRSSLQHLLRGTRSEDVRATAAN